MSFSWTVTPEQAWGDYAEAYANAVETDIVSLVESLLDPIEQWMKENARWQDQTGNARASLYSDLFHVVHQSVTILVSHGPAIDYAIFLEMHPHLGIIADTVDAFGPVLFRGVQEILSRHGG